MEWSFDGMGEWESVSVVCATEDSDHFHYKIVVSEDGTFDVSQSDAELMPAIKPR